MSLARQNIPSAIVLTLGNKAVLRQRLERQDCHSVFDRKTKEVMSTTASLVANSEPVGHYN